MPRYIKYENKRVSNSTYYRKDKMRRINQLYENFNYSYYSSS